MNIDIDNYVYKPWNIIYSEKVCLKKLVVHRSWKDILQKETKKVYFKKLEKFLTERKKVTQIFPYPDLVFNAYRLTPFTEIKVVFAGQDPYYNLVRPSVPQSMGLAFSVPIGCSIPSSLRNIFKNLVKYKHINKLPNHGNLTSWAVQGCMMLNIGLTVEHKKPDSHTRYWTPMTDNIIKNISNKHRNVVFVLWGKYGLDKLQLIDTKKHCTIISSHPSGQACHRPLRQYPAFVKQDHFGKINKYLRQYGKKEVCWNIDT